ncbi:hypothetical protein SNN69_004487, partial [Cronobacter sakazakii]|nr:hypothetical protein [Cronobacter sakazakii]
EFPFTEFIILNDVVVFFYKNKVIFYFKTNEDLNYHQSKNTTDNIKNYHASVVKTCKEIERDSGSYNASTECFYKEMNIVLTYETYYKQLNLLDKAKLLNKVEVGRDEMKKLENGALTVSYKWLGANELVVTQQYDGGLTILHFIQETNGTKLIRELSPD